MGTLCEYHQGRVRGCGSRLWGRWCQVPALNDARCIVSIEADIVERLQSKPRQDRAVCSDRNTSECPNELDAVADLKVRWYSHCWLVSVPQLPDRMRPLPRASARRTPAPARGQRSGYVISVATASQSAYPWIYGIPATQSAQKCALITLDQGRCAASYTFCAGFCGREQPRAR